MICQPRKLPLNLPLPYALRTIGPIWKACYRKLMGRRRRAIFWSRKCKHLYFNSYVLGIGGMVRCTAQDETICYAVRYIWIRLVRYHINLWLRMPCSCLYARFIIIQCIQRYIATLNTDLYLPTFFFLLSLMDPAVTY